MIDELWPEVPSEKARMYLHTCVSLLRKNLRQYGFENIIRYERECYYFEHYEHFTSDVHTFRLGMNNMHEVDDGNIQELTELMNHYKAPLLDTEDYLWAIQPGQQLEQFAVMLLLRMGKHYLSREQYSDTIRIAEQAISYSPYEEDAYRLMMQAYLNEGKHDHVLQTYRQLEHKLSELNIQPSEFSRRLYAKIC